MTLLKFSPFRRKKMMYLVLGVSIWGSQHQAPQELCQSAIEDLGDLLHLLLHPLLHLLLHLHLLHLCSQHL